MNAEKIGRALGGKRTGQNWVARCPAHNDRTPSLSIAMTKDGKVLLHCFAGCRQQDVLGRLRRLGLWGHEAGTRSGNPPAIAPAPPSEDSAARRRDSALAIWREARRAEGSPVETYLQSRGLFLAVPPALRFHPRLWHCSDIECPAMVALVSDGVDGTALGVHRTYLAADGASKAPVDPQKMMLGPCRGGAVRLAEASDTLMVGEGIETCLAAMHSAGKPAWAALSTAGLRTLELPEAIRDVTVLADGDMSGEQAAQDAARRWMRQGRVVRIARAPAGQDFNDLLLEPLSDEEIQP